MKTPVYRLVIRPRFSKRPLYYSVPVTKGLVAVYNLAALVTGKYSIFRDGKLVDTGVIENGYIGN